MNKQTITKQLTEVSGTAFVNLEQIQRALGCGDNTARIFTRGLTYWTVGKTKHFDAEEVAANMCKYLKNTSS